MFKDGFRSKEHNAAIWNARYAHKEAFPNINHDGYKRGGIFGKLYMAHVVAWAIFYGDWPDQIDHINGKPSDNRIENMRNVPQRDNCRNARRKRKNKSGVNGVSLHTSGRWRVRIRAAQSEIHIGMFDSLEEASKARKQADVEYGYHDNHGRN